MTINSRPSSTSTRSWVFQANPDIYDLAGFLATGAQETTWLVNQFKDQVHRGDRVYLWLSGPSAGLVAVGHTLGDPEHMAPDEGRDQFTHQPDKLPEDGLHVRLAIDEIVDPPIAKTLWLHDPVLRETTIVRAPYQTNFRLTLEQDEAVRALLSRNDPWGAAIQLSRKTLSERVTFDADERDYKLVIVERVRTVIEAANSDPRALADAVKNMLAPPNNLVNWRSAAAFRRWVADDPDRAAEAIRAAGSPDDAPQWIERFDRALPTAVVSQRGARLALASLFVMGSQPETWPFFRPTPFVTVERILGWPTVDREGAVGAEYDEHVSFAREFQRRLEEAGVPLRDMLDVQGLIWVLATSRDPEIAAWRGEPEAPIEDDLASAPEAVTAHVLSTLPAASISYANRILFEIDQAGPLTLDELFERGDPERLFKSKRPHIQPRARARALIRYARGLSLLENDDPLRLTASGREYVRAGDAENVFDVTDEQAGLLRAVIRDGAMAGGICWAAVLALSLWDTVENPEDLSLQEFGRALGLAADATHWREEATFRSQGRDYTALLMDSGLLDENRQVTEAGDALLAEVAMPAHPPVAELLARSQANGRVAAPSDGKQTWWVNQGNTYAASREASLLWAPHLNKTGQPLTHWTRLQDARVGDRVLHYSGGSIRAVGTVTAEAIDAPRPPSFPNQDTWNNDGWKLSVNYEPLDDPIALRQIPSTWRTPSAGPFNAAGGVQQGYFFPLSEEFVGRLAAQFKDLGLPTNPNVIASGIDYVEPEFPTIVAGLLASGLRIEERTIRRYHVSLKTRGFVVLSGLSGSGKTALARRYAQIVGAQPLLVAVAPNWTTNEDLLGYVDPINHEYRHTQFSEFLIAAQEEYEHAKLEQRNPQPFHLILDEMNLARVEYYFAKFLSAMELRTDSEPSLIDLGGELQVPLTPNLKFVGTVNIDETTHGFADKVYDRAQLLEMPVDRDQIKLHTDGREYQSLLLAVWDALRRVAPFGFRVLDDIATYVDRAAVLGVAWQEAVDEQLLQKVLPKIKGTDPQIGDALDTLAQVIEDSCPLTYAKIQGMQAAFRDHGFVSYF